MVRLGCSVRIGPIPWLLMPCLIATPGHQQPCYWLYRILGQLSSMERGFDRKSQYDLKPSKQIISIKVKSFVFQMAMTSWWNWTWCWLLNNGRMFKPSKCTGMGVLSQYPPFRYFPKYLQTKLYANDYWSHSCLTGVTASQLRWHPSNMNVIQTIGQILLQSRKSHNLWNKERCCSNPHPWPTLRAYCSNSISPG